MIPLPVEPYLIELQRRMDRDGFRLVVAGGLGIYLKRRWIVRQIEEHGLRPLLPDIPDARATDDIDSFLAMQVFVDARDAEFRAALTDLGYQPYERARYLQFTKPAAPLSSGTAKIDLHVRLPLDERETQHTHIAGHRLSRPGHTARRTLHGWATPEAFAIDEGIQPLPLIGEDPEGNLFEGLIHVPHPFVSLCMKLKAALDHEQRPIAERDNDDRKHAFDVYLLTAMLSPREVDELHAYRQKFSDLPIVAEICRAAHDLFEDPNASGCLIIKEALRGTPPPKNFREVLAELFPLPA